MMKGAPRLVGCLGVLGSSREKLGTASRLGSRVSGVGFRV